MRKAIVIGHFDWHGNDMIGAVVKARNIYGELVRQYKSELIGNVDIYNWRKRKWDVIRQLILAFSKYKNIILVISDTSKSLMNLFGWLKNLFYNNILYVVVGGDIADIIENNPEKIKNLSLVDSFFVETKDCLDKMIRLGFDQTYLLRNFKAIEPLSKSDVIKTYNIPYRFCTFSRVIEQKGILDAIDAIEKINSEYGAELCVLDIYGQIDSSFIDKFKLRLRESTSCKYCGVVDSNDSVKVISEYYCLIFPTKYQSEGIPGTIVDGFASGVPAIASNWVRCNQVITDGFDGIVYGFNNFDDLVEKIKFAINNQSIINKMRENCLSTYELYRAEKAIMPLLKCIK